MTIEILILALIFSAFFSGIEIAFVSSNRLRIELDARKGKLSGKILARFTKSPSDFLGTTLIGNNLALVVFGIMMAKLLEAPLNRWLPVAGTHEAIRMTIETLITTGVVLIAGEFLPKVLFRLWPNKILEIFAVPIYVVYMMLFPLVMAATTVSKFFIRTILRESFAEEKVVFSKIDLEHFLHNIRGEEDTQEIDKKMFERAMYFSEIRVRECMVPRTEIIGIDVESSIEALKDLFIKTKLSRIIVYRDNIDHILGYVHHHALLKNPTSIKEIIMPIKIVPESMSAFDLLKIFRDERKNIAQVVDEYGGTAGIVTLEDVLEEIFGEITDEHDKDELIEQKLDEGDYRFSGRLEIDYLNDKYGLDIPEGDYETLSGFLITMLEDIPKPGDVYKTGSWEFIVQQVSEKKIELVRVKKIRQKDHTS